MRAHPARARLNSNVQLRVSSRAAITTAALAGRMPVFAGPADSLVYIFLAVTYLVGTLIKRFLVDFDQGVSHVGPIQEGILQLEGESVDISGSARGAGAFGARLRWRMPGGFVFSLGGPSGPECERP